VKYTIQKSKYSDGSPILTISFSDTGADVLLNQFFMSDGEDFHAEIISILHDVINEKNDEAIFSGDAFEVDINKETCTISSDLLSNSTPCVLATYELYSAILTWQKELSIFNNDMIK